jgi:hypothetical protein
MKGMRRIRKEKEFFTGMKGMKEIRKKRRFLQG